MEAASLSLILKLGLQPFHPLPFARTGKLQTILGTCWPQPGDFAETHFHELLLSDGDALVLAENTPPGWKDGDRIVALVHGLTGHHKSNYMVRTMRSFVHRGAKVIRINLRCCGPGFGKARNPYHCGISEDTRKVQEWLAHRFPRSPVTQVGFSLGGNITLKMAGEDGEKPSGNLDSLVAVSPPVNIKKTAEMIAKVENQFFDRYFTKRLLYDVNRLHSAFPDLPKHKLPPSMSILEFDDLYTVPRWGFRNANDYYEKASSFQILSQIRIPTLVIGSKDDPVVSGECFSNIPTTPWIEKVISKKGGHIGFLGWGGKKSWRWSDEVLLRWCEENLSGIKKPTK